MSKIHPENFRLISQRLVILQNNLQKMPHRACSENRERLIECKLGDVTPTGVLGDVMW